MKFIATPSLFAPLRQVVLFAREPVRTFVECVLKPPEAVARSRLALSGATLVGQTADAWFVQRRTSAVKRHYLSRFDERHLFIAQLPSPVTTIRRVHECLNAGEVAQAQAPDIATARQGEWFFIAPTPEEARALAGLLGTSRLAAADIHTRLTSWSPSRVRCTIRATARTV